VTLLGSLYTDDASLFLKPITNDLKIINCILQLFTDASGLVTNMSKTHFYPIRCDQVNIAFLSNADISVSTFPYTYLGLPLHFRRPSKATLQPLVKKIGNRLSRWKMDFLTYPGRKLLIKIVLSSMPTHMLTVFKPPKGIISIIDRYRRNFLWRGKDPDQVKGGHCLVN
jgi:hypothetical protein